jgi:hypothetical protein
VSRFPNPSDLPSNAGIYTRDIYKYRIWCLDLGPASRAWILDGADYRGNVSWNFRSFATYAEALAALPDFAKDNPLVNASRTVRRIAGVKSTLPRRADHSIWLRTGVRIGSYGKSEFSDTVKSQMLDGIPDTYVPLERRLPRNAGLERSGRD